MSPKIKAIILRTVGLIFCTLPVIGAIFSYFPLWKERGAESVLSGFTLLLLLASLVPFFNVIKKALRSPAAHTMWFIAFVFFFVFSKIADEMTVISFVGFLGNLIGALFFKLSNKVFGKNTDFTQKEEKL